MSDTIIVCIVNVITTLVTASVTIVIAYRTYSSQKKKDDADIKRLQTVNCLSSLELFKAYIANLIRFCSPTEVQLNVNDLKTCLEKMKLTEQYLAELTETNLPDTFIEEFRFYRLKLAFQRIYLEQRLNCVSENVVSSSLFDDLDTLELITSINKFVSSHKQKPDGH